MYQVFIHSFFLFLTTTTVANAWYHNNNTWSQEKEVATQRQTLIHTEDIEDKISNFYLHGCYTCHTSLSTL